MSRLKSLQSASSGHDQLSPTTAWVQMVAMFAAKNKKAEQETTRRKTQQAIKQRAAGRRGTQQTIKQQASKRLGKQHTAA